MSASRHKIDSISHLPCKIFTSFLLLKFLSKDSKKNPPPAKIRNKTRKKKQTMFLR